ncbi:hypothetical protein [Romboutsia sp.]|nr:hypothetical protein [Romboutsia sp.]HSQ87989.1 hypothetical protein [Romboutsia sp.]
MITIEFLEKEEIPYTVEGDYVLVDISGLIYKIKIKKENSGDSDDDIPF